MGGEEFSVVVEFSFSSQAPPHALTCLGLLHALFLSGFVVNRVLLDLFDDSFLLHFPLKPSERAFDRFAVFNNDERQ